jgi:hypothetical protein
MEKMRYKQLENPSEIIDFEDFSIIILS